VRSSRPVAPATLEDWLAIPAEKRAEFIDGQIVYSTMPGLIHGTVQKRIGTALDPYDRRRRDPDRPGGWWISQEVDMFLGGIGCRPDLVGWERERDLAPPRMSYDVRLRRRRQSQ
jgi:Uma2 family endonuclease